ncbi:ABC transporter ATP-binding protein [Paenibacillus sp. NPDC057934]|uniref:ABC transporter ATP-binding protein n=1 Tax=Paenibacillus sp. NPDC057934 TaxID=3346282 RepID=UPI0036DAADD1
MNIVEVKELVKSYGDKFTLQIHFNLNQGEYLGLVGENGAGKTTLLRIICGLLRPTSGETTVFGHASKNVKKISKYIGVINQYTGLPDLLKVREFLKNECVMRDVDFFSLSDELALLGLDRYLDTKICDLSEGNKRKIVILKSILHKPKLLIMDEPTVGIDPLTRNEIWSYIRKMKEYGVSAIISTHYLYEIEQICDRVIFLDRGKVQKEGTVDELIHQNHEVNYLSVTVNGGIDAALEMKLRELLVDDTTAQDISCSQNSFLLTTRNDSCKVIPHVVQMLYSNDIEIRALNTGVESLEEVMTQLNKRKSEVKYELERKSI